MTDPDPSLRHSPLDAEHRALGREARRVRRLGDADPVRAACSRSTGRAGAPRSSSTSRTSARCGSPAPTPHALLQRALTNDLDRIAPGRAQYTHLLDPDDAHVVDDIIVWWVGARRVPRDAERVEHRPHHRRAGRGRGRRRAAVTSRSPTSPRPGRCSRSRARRPRALLAAVGPGAGRGRALRGRAGALGGRGVHRRRNGVHRRGWGRDPRPRGATRRALAGDRRRRRHAGRARCARHAAARGRAARCTATSWGRGSRRSRPGSAGWCAGTRATSGVVTRSRPNASGASPAGSEGCWWTGAARRVRGYPVVVDGVAVGEVTSGNFSPMLERAIALAFLPPETPRTAPACVEMRGTRCRRPSSSRRSSRGERDRSSRRGRRLQAVGAGGLAVARLGLAVDRRRRARRASARRAALRRPHAGRRRRGLVPGRRAADPARRGLRRAARPGASITCGSSRPRTRRCTRSSSA